MNFYRAFEEKYRGPRDLIKSRLKVYLPFVDVIKKIYPTGSAVDLGCGRGEWLELLSEQGFSAQGVDLDGEMLEACKHLNLNVHLADAISFLKNLPNESQAIISGFHLAEHLVFDDLRVLVEEAKRVLLPAGLLILETPNPENIIVGSSSFYLDPTHQRPLPPLLLSFLPEYYGFARTKILRLQEAKDLNEINSISLSNIFNDVSPDYAIIAQKTAEPKFITLANNIFDQEYGITLEHLTIKYEQQIEKISKKLNHLENDLIATLETVITAQNKHIDTLQEQHRNLAKELIHIKSKFPEQEIKFNTQLVNLTDALDRARNQISEQEIQNQKTARELHQVYQSKSWLLTRPLRTMNMIYKDSARALFIFSASWFTRYPKLRKMAVNYIDKFPKISVKLRASLNEHHFKKSNFLPAPKILVNNFSLKKHNLDSKKIESILHDIKDDFFIENKDPCDIKQLNDYVTRQIKILNEKVQR